MEKLLELADLGSTGYFIVLLMCSICSWIMRSRISFTASFFFYPGIMLGAIGGNLVANSFDLVPIGAKGAELMMQMVIAQLMATTFGIFASLAVLLPLVIMAADAGEKRAERRQERMGLNGPRTKAGQPPNTANDLRAKARA